MIWTGPTEEGARVVIGIEEEEDKGGETEDEEGVAESIPLEEERGGELGTNEVVRLETILMEEEGIGEDGEGDEEVEGVCLACRCINCWYCFAYNWCWCCNAANFGLGVVAPAGEEEEEGEVEGGEAGMELVSFICCCISCIFW